MFSVSPSASLFNKFLALSDGRNQRQGQLFEDVLQNSCCLKFREFYRKTRVLESLFNKFTDRQACNFIRKTPTQVFSSETCKIFKNNIFDGTHQWLFLRGGVRMQSPNQSADEMESVGA